MGRVKGRQALLLAILVYVTLDLSLSMMPGAFQFDPAESVESIQSSRARTAAPRVVVLPSVPGATIVSPRSPADIKDRPVPIRRVDRRPHIVMTWSSPSSRDSAPPSEDPH